MCISPNGETALLISAKGMMFTIDLQTRHITTLKQLASPICDASFYDNSTCYLLTSMFLGYSIKMLESHSVKISIKISIKISLSKIPFPKISLSLNLTLSLIFPISLTEDNMIYEYDVTQHTIRMNYWDKDLFGGQVLMINGNYMGIGYECFY